ncbi:hypothetical protein Salat_0507500 [Sesamum alatum]|uniref:Uncharacterized protein n=1 Tax=Sesamum alatum TaxID=300844 RepID=A0AAE2D0V7_9LAMI|nr:hypothetical protein Salat_0507500 [Sesamum alatum]
MEGGRFDASAYMLFEASGDSEAGYFDGKAEAEDESGSAAEDDAQSCSYGSLSDRAAVHGVDDAGGDADVDDSDGEEEYGAGRNSDEEDGVVDQCCGVAAEKVNEHKANCEDSNERETETDRLFWEACLAS